MKRILSLGVATLLILQSSACRETLPELPKPALPVANAVEAGVVASRLAAEPGDTVMVLVRLARGTDVAVPGSFAVRLGYDQTRLRYDSEQTLDNAGLRAVNGEIPGDLRAAGASPSGFVSGDLLALRFIALGAGSVGTLRLSVDQLAAADGAEFSGVVIRPPVADASVSR